MCWYGYIQYFLQSNVRVQLVEAWKKSFKTLCKRHRESNYHLLINKHLLSQNHIFSVEDGNGISCKCEAYNTTRSR